MDRSLPADAFARVLRDEALTRRATRKSGGVDWALFVREHLPGESYEGLRKVLAGDREPGVPMMQRVAAALGIEPERFAEYRLWQFQRQFQPSEVGLEAALEALRRFADTGR